MCIRDRLIIVLPVSVYTPAPDIVHEAAGHAPILADKDYRDYLCSYAEVASKAIFSNEDIIKELKKRLGTSGLIEKASRD